ncbi:TetR/AcrR family transcriptional regulator [Kocuria sp. M1R5S2]|uniref:TetR/AcrR family transcriptional regulator n=1 Tax=Kocuria rhizosphaerae TaxID=3376285 RepID=UPI00378AE3C6
MSNSVTGVPGGTPEASEPSSPRERLLRAAGELLAGSRGKPVSTREITKLAGVTAPTLYHHFGDKDGLMEAVALRGFEEFVRRERGMQRSAAPIADVQRLWDVHVQFGLSQPQLYSLMFGSGGPGRRPVLVEEAERLLEAELHRVAETGLLAVPPRQAARAVLAANIGVTLMLVADAPDEGEAVSAEEVAALSLSTQTRDAVLRSVVTDPAAVGSAPDGAPSGGGPPSYVSAAIALNATLQSSHPDQLSGTELTLFLEWLHRLSTTPEAGRQG